MSGFREWTAGDVVWGSTLCEAPGCFAAAALLADNVPLCVGDADLLCERQAALAVADLGLREALPDPWELARRDRARYRPRKAVWELELEGQSPETWLAEQGYFGERIDTSDPDWDIPF